MGSRRELALRWARTDTFEKRLATAYAMVRRAFAVEDSWYVAFSAGKDSTCTLELARAVRPETPAVISIHKYRLPETTEYLERTPNVSMVASGSTHGTGWSRNWLDAEEARGAVEIAAWFDRDADRYNFGRPEKGTFLGLRKDENVYRRILLSRMGPLFQSKRHGGQWLCSPIAHWTTLDVWAFIHSRELDYNRAYDKMEDLGVPMDAQRVGPLAVDRVLGYGQLAILKRGWPELFNEYAAEHPEARTYA